MKIKKIIASIPIEANGMMLNIIHITMAFFIGVILARTLGSEMFGKYSYIVAWVVLALSLVTAGFPMLLIREIAVYKQNENFELIEGILSVAVTFVILLFSVFFVSIMVANSFGLMQKWSIEVIFSGLLSLFFLSLTSVYESTTRGLGNVLVGQLSNKVIRPVVQFLLLIILVLGVYNEDITITTAMYVFTFSNFMGFLFAFFMLRKKRINYANVHKRFDFSSWFSSFWRMSFLVWIGALNLQLSVVLLGFIGSNTDVGNFRVASQIALLIPFGLTVMNSLQMPDLSRAFNSGTREELQRLAGRSSLISTLVALPIIIVAIFFGETVILKVFGSEYIDAVSILFVLSLGQLISVISGSSGVLMLIAREEHKIMLTQALVLILNTILCITLIPTMGAIGAAIASAVSLSLKNIYIVISIYKRLGIVSLPGIYKKNN